MKQRAEGWQITFALTWRQAVAGLLVIVGLLVLGLGLVRPMVSAYIGRQVSRELNEAVAREVVAALVGEPDAPAAAEPGASPAAERLPTAAVAAAGPGAAQAAPPGAAVEPSAGPAAAPQLPQAPVALATAQTGAPSAPQPAVSGRSIVRAIVAPAAPPAQPGAGAEPTAAPEESRPAPAVTASDPQPAAPTPLIATPITSPDPPRAIEEVVAALPSGAITVTEEKVNARIGARAAALGPVERIVVRFLPGQVQVTLTVLGQDTVGTSGLGVAGGRVVAQSPQLSGALGPFISVSDLVRPVEDELNAIVAAAGRQLRDVRIEQGQIVVTLD